MARTTMKKSNPRQNVVGVRFTNQEMKEIASEAKKERLSLSTFVRSIVFRAIESDKMSKLNEIF